MSDEIERRVTTLERSHDHHKAKIEGFGEQMTAFKQHVKEMHPTKIDMVEAINAHSDKWGKIIKEYSDEKYQTKEKANENQKPIMYITGGLMAVTGTVSLVLIVLRIFGVI